MLMKIRLLTWTSHHGWMMLEGRGFTGCGKTLWRLALALSAPPRRSARHPSSSEEGSVFNNSPPDSGGVAPWAPGWSYAEDSFSAACSAAPKSRLSPAIRPAPRAACGRKLRGVRDLEIIRRPCNGGAKASPFQTHGEKSKLGDEESRAASNMLRARSFAALRMTHWRVSPRPVNSSRPRVCESP